MDWLEQGFKFWVFYTFWPHCHYICLLVKSEIYYSFILPDFIYSLFFFHFCLFFNEYITYTWPQLFVSLNPLYSKNTSTLRFIINLYNMVSWIKIQTTPKQSSSGTHLVKYFRSRRVVLHLLFFLILRSLRYNGLMN